MYILLVPLIFPCNTYICTICIMYAAAYVRKLLTNFRSSCHFFVIVPKPMVTWKLNFCFIVLKINDADVVHIPMAIQKASFYFSNHIIIQSHSYNLYVTQMFVCFNNHVIVGVPLEGVKCT